MEKELKIKIDKALYDKLKFVSERVCLNEDLLIIFSIHSYLTDMELNYAEKGIFYGNGI